MTKTHVMMAAIATAALCFCLAGCDVGINPLLFDGGTIHATYNINESGTHYSGSTTVELNDIVSEIDESADSVKVFNITVQINPDSTPAGTTVLGAAMFGADTVVRITNVKVSDLAAEQSIFASFPGITLKSSGVAALVAAINNAMADPGNSHPATFSVDLTASSGPVVCTAHVRVYTQVFTKPK